MLGLTDLEVYNSVLNLNHTNNNIELYTDTFHEFSIEEVKDELEEILSIPNITDDRSRNETIGPRKSKTYWKLRSKNQVLIVILFYY